MSHPDPAAPPDTRPIEPGEVWTNPVTLERAVVVELPWLNDEGHPLQLALFATEFSDVIAFRKPPAAVQRVVFSALAPIARRRGYRATYPRLSRTALAPRPSGTSA